MEVGSSGVGSRVRTSTRNAGEVVQHLVSASFDVVFEESGEAGMFSSDDDRFEQRAATLVKSNESRSSRSGKEKAEDRGEGLRTVLDCVTIPQAHGLRSKRGGKGLCTIAGCTSNARGRGLCFKHGDKAVCTMQGCTSNAQGRGLCSKHGGTGVCTMRGCTFNARARGRCFKHGGKEMRTVPGC